MSVRMLAGRAIHVDEVMGSRFIAIVAPVSNREAAAALVAEARAAHRGATHYCWAYRVGPEQRFSDDGEPGGTAGRPMLEVLLKRDLDHAAAVVVRYFGGRKLGAGGLARAYGGAVARAVQQAGERLVEPTRRLLVRAPFAHVDAVLRAIERARGSAHEAPRYDAQGVRLLVRLPEVEVEPLRGRLAELTQGAALVDSLPDGHDMEER